MARVSVIIPGRTERYFQKTVDSVLESATGDVEVVAVVDGDEAEPRLCSDDPRVKILRLDKAIGQRAAYNLGVRESTGEFVMKIDAHAKLSPGFDEVLQSHCADDAVLIPEMRRLDVTKWKDKRRGKTHFMYFGLDCYCYYWKDFRRRAVWNGSLAETMTGQGSCWFTSRKWNDYIGLLDERVGSWGNVGIEISLRTWLCGGSQFADKDAWQAHWFRAKEGGFPYPMSGRKVAHAHKFTSDNYYFKDDAFENQCRPFRWLIERFAPVAQWEAFMVDGYSSPRVIVYYTDSRLDEKLAVQVRKQIKRCAGPIPIISVSQKPLDFGRNICVGEKPQTYKSAYEQMREGINAASPDSIIYLCEHDVFYHPSHFAFLPKRKTHAYFNQNCFHYALGADSFLKAKGKRAQSQCVARREVLLAHCDDRLQNWTGSQPPKMQIRWFGFNSDRPNVDIRHGENLTTDKGDRLKWLAGDLKGTVNLAGWGRPSHFESKVGYKTPPDHVTVPQVVSTIAPSRNGDASNHLRKKWAKLLPQPSPIRCRNWTRVNLAKTFAALGYRRGAEVGVKRGEYSQVLCTSNPGVEMLCIDLWDAYYEVNTSRYFQQAQKRLEPYNATLIRKPSALAALDIPDGSLDFVYIDADHRFDYVMQDLIVWAPKVRHGGIVSGHDYYRFRNAGVVDAVDAYTRAHDIREWWLTDEKTASFFWVK